MTDTPYVPSSGLTGKLKRQMARRLATSPMSVRLERPLVSFAFDDFPRSAARAGKDALEAYGWRGTYFASAGLAGQTNHLGTMFDAGDLASLQRDGHEIGCHTYAHMDAARAHPAATEADVARNAAALADMGLDAPLRCFAFPYGEASPAAKRLLIRRFRALRSVWTGINYDGADRALLKAVGIDGGEAGIARALDFAEAVARRPGWLIYYMHDIRGDPSPWGCTPAQLARVLDAVARSGAEVLPVSDALDRLTA